MIAPLLQKYHYLDIVPFEKSIYHTAPLPKKVKLTPQLLKLNYAKFAPFKNPNIISFPKENYLSLWFYKEEYNAPILIPESYLYYKALVSNEKDALYIIYDEIIKIIIIKDTKIYSAFIIDNIEDELLQLSIDETSIDNIIEIKKDKLNPLKKKALESISLKEIFTFMQVTTEPKELLHIFVQKVTYPIVAFIVLTIVMGYLQKIYLNDQISTLKHKYKEAKDKNKDLKDIIQLHNKNVKKYKIFIDKELTYPPSIAMLNSIYTIFQPDDKAYLESISMSENNIIVKLKTDMNPVLFLNRLNKIKYFKRVVIQNSYRPRGEMKIISYDIEIIERKAL